MQLLKKSLFLLCIVVLTSCAGLTFSQQSLDDDQRIITDAVALIQKSNEPYTAHASEVEKLRTFITEVYQREQSRKMNNATVAMWQEVMNGNGNLFSLLDQWKTNGSLSAAMTTEASRQIQRLLNSIYDLEKYKKK
jgi:peptidase E